MKDQKNEKLQAMTAGGRKLGRIREELLRRAQPGVRLLDLDDFAKESIAKEGGEPSFMTVAGYRWATCLCVNDVVVHGVPSGYKLKAGDLLTVDVGILYKGFHTDTAWTKIIGAEKDFSDPLFSGKKKFLAAGERALRLAIEEAVAGNHIGHISAALQKAIEGEGYRIVKSLVGHGIGRTLHEEPQIPGFVKGSVEQTVRIEPGMTLAIEAIYALGNARVTYESADGWSIATKDGSLSAVFEHTVAVGSAAVKPVILTKTKE